MPFITKVKIQSTQEDFFKKSIVWSKDHASMPYYGSSNAVMEGAGHPIKRSCWCGGAYLRMKGKAHPIVNRSDGS